jgi:hypothetical protein
MIFSLLIFAGIVRPVGLQSFEDELNGFEDGLDVLTKLSEQITIDQLSLKSFRCLEKTRAIETDKKTKAIRHREASSRYEVSRQADKRFNDKPIFSETRTPSEGAAQTSEIGGIPLIENPFTGYITQAFSFDNRLSNDFKNVKKEKLSERDCQVFSFQTVPEISAAMIPLLGKPVPLRQKGLLWVDNETHQLIRVTAKQTKLPKGCLSYEYRINLKMLTLFGRRFSIPVSTELIVDFKDKTYQVIQEYSDFQPI